MATYNLGIMKKYAESCEKAGIKMPCGIKVCLMVGLTTCYFFGGGGHRGVSVSVVPRKNLNLNLGQI